MRKFLRRLKAVMPGPIVYLQASVRSAIHRQKLWRDLLAECGGITEADQSILEESRKAARKTLFEEPEKWLEPRATSNVSVVVKDGFRFNIRANTDDLGHIRQLSHQPLLDAVLSNLPVGGVAIDAGANIGLFSANFSRKVGPSGNVIAIEMMPKTAEQLRKTVSLNQLENVEVVEKALSDREGQKVEITMPDTEHFGQASIIRSHNTVGDTIAAQTTTLDVLTASFQKIHVIKLDLEGAEVLALSGGKKTLDKTDCILFEAHPEDPSIDGIFESAGFSIRQVDGLNKVAVRGNEGLRR